MIHTFKGDFYTVKARILVRFDGDLALDLVERGIRRDETGRFVGQIDANLETSSPRERLESVDDGCHGRKQLIDNDNNTIMAIYNIDDNNEIRWRLN